MDAGTHAVMGGEVEQELYVRPENHSPDVFAWERDLKVSKSTAHHLQPRYYQNTIISLDIVLIIDYPF